MSLKLAVHHAEELHSLDPANTGDLVETVPADEGLVVGGRSQSLTSSLGSAHRGGADVAKAGHSQIVPSAAFSSASCVPRDPEQDYSTW
jgi:hypothetical protein